MAINDAEVKPALLFVHAHPDDETIFSGATMAKYAAAGNPVTLVTCTAGEEGEVLVADLAHLISAKEDKLGPERQIELSNAMQKLGVRDHRFLGGFGKYRDSGMLGTPQNENPQSFWQADLLAAATDLVEVIREIRPAALITYDDFGGYGHPDHIKTHQVAMYAAVLAAVPSFLPHSQSWQVPRIYWCASPRGVMQAAADKARAAGIDIGISDDDIANWPSLVDDYLVDLRIDATQFNEKKLAALSEHRTQLDLESGFMQFLIQVGGAENAVEYYRIAGGAIPLAKADSMYGDLLAGL